MCSMKVWLRNVKRDNNCHEGRTLKIDRRKKVSMSFSNDMTLHSNKLFDLLLINLSTNVFIIHCKMHLVVEFT